MRLKNFDSVFAPGAAADTPAPAPQASDATRDLGEATEAQAATPAAPVTCEPPSMTTAQFKQKYASTEGAVVVTLSLGPGQPVSCTFVDGKLFIHSTANTRVIGAKTANAKPLLMYAGGSWIPDPAKVPCLTLFFPLTFVFA